MLGQNHRLLQVLLLQLLTHSLQVALLPELLLLAQIQVLLLQLLNRPLQVARRLYRLLLAQILVLALAQTDPQSQAPTKTLYHPQNLQPRSSTHPLSSHSLIQRHRRPWLTLILLTS